MYSERCCVCVLLFLVTESLVLAETLLPNWKDSDPLGSQLAAGSIAGGLSVPLLCSGRGLTGLGAGSFTGAAAMPLQGSALIAEGWRVASALYHTFLLQRFLSAEAEWRDSPHPPALPVLFVFWSLCSAEL